MLKTVSSITNAIGALNYKGTWNASTNTPTLASGVGTKGDYYVVSVAGSTTLDGISNWGVGDLATFNGIVWQRVEGGADGNFVNLSVSSTSTLSGLTASTALALDASKNVVSVTNTGTGSNVLATSPTLVDNVTLSTGNLVIGTAGKGIDFSATSHPAGMTSELLADYEEGTWTGTMTGVTTPPTTPITATGSYTKIGNSVTVSIIFTNVDTTGAVGQLLVTGLPYTAKSGLNQIGSVTSFGLSIPNKTLNSFFSGGGTSIEFVSAADNGAWSFPNITAGASKYLNITTTYLV